MAGQLRWPLGRFYCICFSASYKYTISGENLKGENVGESPLMKQIDIGEENFEHHSSNSPNSKLLHGSRTACMHDCLIRIYHLMQ